MEAGLREVVEWAADLADLLRQQALRGSINPDLLVHARELIGLMRAEQARTDGKN